MPLATFVHPALGLGVDPAGCVVADPAAGEAGGGEDRPLIADHRPDFDEAGHLSP